MKKIIAIVAIIVMLVGAAVYVCEHTVKVTYNYKWNDDTLSRVLGRTELRVEKIETKLITGEIIDRDCGVKNVEYTAEMQVFDNEHTETKIVFR